MEQKTLEYYNQNANFFVEGTTHYIRDVLQHLENKHNTKYTDQELAQSIESMRLFLEGKNQTENGSTEE